MDKKNLRKKSLREKGITLVALVVTIIVLLILAGVAIQMALGENGLIFRAKDSRQIWLNSSQNEETMMSQLNNDIDTFTQGNYTAGDAEHGTTGTGSGGNQENITNLTKTSVSELREGDRVTYTTGDGTEIPCVVLYDSTGDYGIQLISADIVDHVKIGPYDYYDATDSEKYEKSKLDYNTIVAILNSATQSYLNTDFSPEFGVRCVGSSPSYPPILSEENSGTFTSSYDRFRQYDNQFKNGDLSETWGDAVNVITDYVQMKKENINCVKARFRYWLACRCLREYNDQLTLGAIDVYGDWETIEYQLLITFNSDTIYAGNNLGLRPVFKIKDNISYITIEGQKKLVK